MKYVLITSLGKVLTFYVRDCAICYKNIYGGTLIEEIVTTPEVVTTA